MIRFFLIFTIFYSIFNVCLAQDPQKDFIGDIQKLEDIEKIYGDSTRLYCDKLISVSRFYTQDPAYINQYKNIVHLIIKSNHTIRHLYGLDSPQYNQLMTALYACLRTQYHSPEDYQKCAPLVITSLKELEPFICDLHQNRYSFVTLLSSLYKYHEPNASIALKYARIRYLAAEKGCDKQSLEYLYALDNLIECLSFAKRYEETKKFLIKRNHEIGNEDSHYELLLSICLNHIDDDSPLSYTKYIITELPERAKIENLHSFLCYISKCKDITLLSYFKKVYLSDNEDYIKRYEFYKLIGSEMIALTDKINQGLEYLLHAEEIANKYHIYTNYKTHKPGKTLIEQNVYNSIASAYSYLKQYDRAIDYLIKSLKLLKAYNLTQDSKHSQRILDLYISYLRDYYEFNEHDDKFKHILINYIHEFYQCGGTLKQMSILYHGLAIHSDYKYCKLIEQGALEIDTDKLSWYNYYLTMATFMHNQKLYKDASTYYLYAVDCCYKLGRRDLLYSKVNNDIDSHYLQRAATCFAHLGEEIKELESWQKSIHDIVIDFGKDSKEHYKGLKNYIYALVSYKKTEMLLAQVNTALDLSKKIFGESSDKYINDLTEKVFTLHMISEFEQCKNLINQINLHYPHLDSDISTQLLTYQALCNTGLQRFEDAYNDYIDLLSKVNRFEDEANIILALINVSGYMNSEAKFGEVEKIISDEIYKINESSTIDSTHVCSFFQRLYDNLKVRYPDKCTTFLRKKIEYMNTQNHEDIFFTLRQILESYRFNANEAYKVLIQLEDLFTKHLSARKDLYYLLKSDWGTYYITNLDKNKGFDYYKICYKYYSGNNVNLLQKRNFFLQYAMAYESDSKFEDAIRIYNETIAILSNDFSDSNTKLIIWERVIECYLKLGYPDKAANIYQKYKDISHILGVSDNSFGCHFFQGRLYFYQHNIEKAKACYIEAKKYITSKYDYYRLQEALRQLQ